MTMIAETITTDFTDLEELNRDFNTTNSYDYDCRNYND